MKAIYVSTFGNESVLEYKDVDIPEPGENEVRVRVMAAGVNPVETYIRSGKYGMLPNLPYIPGTDGAGVIDAVGAGVSGTTVGERVFIAASLAKCNTGTYAEYAVCDADAVWPLPDSVSFAQGAGLGTPGLAATYALFSRAQARPGETVLVHGATGGVGTLAIQLARRAGMTVVGTAGSAEGEDLVRELGAHMVFNHRKDRYIEDIAHAIPGGPNVVIEMLANINLVKDFSILALRGRIVVVGSRGALEFNPRDTMMRDGAVLGMLVSNMTHDDFVANMHLLAAGLENGMKVVVGGELALREAAEAHRLVIAGGNPGKVVLLSDG